MKDQRKFKDRYPEYRKKSKLNGRYSSLTAGTVPAFSIMNMEREITYQNTYNPHWKQDKPAADHPVRVPQGIRTLY